MNRANSKRGFALAVVLLVLLLITVMGLVLGTMGAANLQQIRATGEKTSALHAANGALHELMDTLYNTPSYGTAGTETGTGTYASSAGTMTYWYTFNSSSGQPYCTNNLNGTTAVTGYGGRVVPPGMALLYAAADMKPENQSTDPVRVAAVATNRYPYAIASDGTINIGDVSSAVPGQGHVRSNNTGGSPNINADVVDGQTFSRDGSGSIDVSSGSGPENYDQPQFNIPDINIPDIVASYSTAGVSGAHPYGGPADEQYASDVTIRNSTAAGCEINGVFVAVPTTIYVNGNVTFQGNAGIPRGLHIFCTGDVTANGQLDQVGLWEGRRTLASRGGKAGDPTPSPSPSPTATATPSPSPTGTASPTPSPSPSPGAGPVLDPTTNFIVCGGAFRTNGGSANSINIIAGTGIRQNGASNYNGFFYVRNGALDINGNSDLNGVIVTKGGVNGDLIAGNTDVNYDPSVLQKLGGLSIALTGTCRTTAWWVED